MHMCMNVLIGVINVLINVSVLVCMYVFVTSVLHVVSSNKVCLFNDPFNYTHRYTDTDE